MFVGVLKVTPFVNKDMNRETRRLFVEFAKVVPLSSLLNIKVSPKHYRLFVGSLEILSGVILTLIPGRLKEVANIILWSLTALTIYSHYMINDKFERMAPSIVFFLMLSCRLVVNWQLTRKLRKLQSRQETLNQIPVTDSKRKKRE